MATKNEGKTGKDGAGGVRFRLGHGSYEINRPGRGNVVYGPGDEFELNPRDIQDLRVILQLLKQINSKGTRKDVNAWNRVKNQATGETERVERFEIVGESDKCLPEILRKHKYTPQGVLLDEEKKAILELCPDFPFNARSQKNSPMLMGLTQ